jgi:uncharacterized protein with NAD-binding domain and iron-sulfur cluster
MKTRVAILGSGCGAMAAAFELTSTPERRAKYEVTVYQQGWRAGGKGASGRNPHFGQRIEEHGLHMFMGFYDHAFRVMDRCYQEWKKDPKNPFQTWRDAVEPQNLITLQERVGRSEEAQWSSWNIHARVLPGVPGESRWTWENERPYKDILRELHSWVIDRAIEAGLSKPILKILEAARRHVDAFPSEMEAFSAEPEMTINWAILQNMADLEAAQIAEQIEAEKAGAGIRHLRLMFRLGLACLKGWMRDMVVKGKPLDFQAIDDLDFREWLVKHGAGIEDARSAPITALYCLGFAYVGGDSSQIENAQASAGVCFHVMLSLLVCSRGAPLWKFKAGMGDVIFAPLYEVLRERGVRFEFFQRVEQLGLSADKRHVERIELTQQVALKGPSYEPLVQVPVEGGHVLPCWPSEPRWEQIDGGEALRERLAQQGLTLESFWCNEKVGQRTLVKGQDFDAVVFGISLGAVPHLCGELMKANPAWVEMVEKVQTVRTQALQLWLRPSLEQLGWKAGSTVATSYAEPFDSWGEMSHLLPFEQWPPGSEQPQSVEYFCGAMPDGAEPVPPRSDSRFPAREAARVKRNAMEWLSAFIRPLWPEATSESHPNGLDWSLLVDPENRQGLARLDAQYWRANIDPSERYVLSVPKSMRARLEAGGSGFDNLFLAGDWVATRLNAGCAEAAMEGGLNAAQAVLERYPLER